MQTSLNVKNTENRPGNTERVFERDFTFTDRDFNFIRSLVSDKTGIILSEIKRDLVYGRLSRRLRKLGLTKFSDYCEILKSGDDTEFVNFVNAITTNLTSFFREPHHFDYLTKDYLPEIVKKSSDKRIRIWSAGCSTGEEPYSIAMVLRESIPGVDNWDVKILATDLDSNVLEHAASGIYDIARIAGLPKGRTNKWFKKGKDENNGLVRVSSELRNMITFKQLNLMEEWPMKGKFDFIFCRNVVIYFDKPTQCVLFDRYANYIKESGRLFVGHSENLSKVSDRFRLIGKTIYSKIR